MDIIEYIYEDKNSIYMKIRTVYIYGYKNSIFIYGYNRVYIKTVYIYMKITEYI
jgi:hypothetical protein